MVASTPTVLGEFDADDDGVIDVEVDLPSDLGNGTHHLALYGLESGVGFSQEFVVADADDQSALPRTGSDSTRTAGFALVLASTGALLSLAARRSRRRLP